MINSNNNVFSNSKNSVVEIEAERLDDLNKTILNTKYVNFTNSQRMARFKNVLNQAFKIVKKTNERKENKKEPTTSIKKVNTVSKESIPAGSILLFNYEDETGKPSIRRVLAVTSGGNKGKTSFTSTKFNNLLMAYDLDSADAVTLYNILKDLYNNTAACTYKEDPSELRKIVPGISNKNFKTYNLENVTGLHVMTITGI